MKYSGPSRLGFFALSLLCTAVPYCFVSFPPAADLAQHLDQVHLFFRVLDGARPDLRINPLSPYALSYLWLFLTTAAFPAAWKPAAAMAGLACAHCVAVHGLAARLRLSPLAALLACVFFFNHVVYWGFYPFAFGWVFFCAFLAVLLGDPRKADVYVVAGILIALFFTHVYWLVAAMILTAVLFCYPEGRPRARRLVPALLPALFLFLLWSFTQARHAPGGAYVWLDGPAQRLGGKFLRWSLDGLKGNLEWLPIAAGLFWIAAGFLRGTDANRGGSERGALYLFALVFLGLALCLPNGNPHSIHLASRWAPFAVMLAILASPGPRLRPTLIVVVCVVFSLLSLDRWRKFEREELRGLSDALAHVPPGARLLGLDYARESRYIAHYPFLHMAAYGRPLSRARELGVSFTDIFFCLVTRAPDTPREKSISVFHPDQITPEQIQTFDHVLLHARPGETHSIEKHANFQLLIGEKSDWRLYRAGKGSTP